MSKSVNEKELYENIKKTIDIKVSEIDNCCKIGCSFCCYQQIEVLNFEVSIIKKAIEDLSEGTKKAILVNLNTYFDYFNNNTPTNKTLDPFDIFAHFQEMRPPVKIKCPMLLNNKCSIYENRPLACRIHVVKEKPNICDKNPNRNSSKPAMEIREILLMYLKTQTKDTFILPLSYIISEIIDPKRNNKPIMKTFLS